MYTPRGHGLSEVGDIEVFPHGDELHLFHLTLPDHDLVQHVVSTDGLAWKTLPHEIRSGEPGECDDDQIWTMSVSEHDGAFKMLYTALARAEDGMVQRTALATSDDLIHWRKHDRNPVAQVDPRWYETEPGPLSMTSWRDPKPIEVDGTWYSAVNARTATGPIMRRGCVGLFPSTDFEGWEVQPPIVAPGRFWDLECPQIFTIDGAVYLTAAVMEDRTQRYWMASAIDGPWAIPHDGGILAPRGHYAGRVCAWQGQHLYFCWHLPYKCHADWATARNPHGKYIVAPLTLTQRQDGSLACGSFPGWANYELDSPLMVGPMPATLFQHTAPGGSYPGWYLQTQPGELDLVATPEPIQDFSLNATLTLDGQTGGVAFRLDGDTGGGYFIELGAGSEQVVLQRWLLTTEERSGRHWFAYDELQRGRLRAPFQPGVPPELRLLCDGPYIDCLIEGEVVIATLSAARTEGRLGVRVDAGSAQLTNLEIAPLRTPEHHDTPSHSPRPAHR